MNEQIKELLNKTSAFGPGGDTMDRYNCSLSDLEKFAQLIVRECAEVVRIQNEQFMDNESHYGVVSTDILKHFGFE